MTSPSPVPDLAAALDASPAFTLPGPVAMARAMAYLLREAPKFQEHPEALGEVLDALQLRREEDGSLFEWGDAAEADPAQCIRAAKWIASVRALFINMRPQRTPALKCALEVMEWATAWRPVAWRCFCMQWAPHAAAVRAPCVQALQNTLNDVFEPDLLRVRGMAFPLAGFPRELFLEDSIRVHMPAYWSTWAEDDPHRYVPCKHLREWYSLLQEALQCMVSEHDRVFLLGTSSVLDLILKQTPHNFMSATRVEWMAAAIRAAELRERHGAHAGTGGRSLGALRHLSITTVSTRVRDKPFF